MALPLTLALALQVAQTGVVGVVRDRITGEALEGASVALIDADRVVYTDAAGRYAFDRVLPGPNHLEVQMNGFEARTLHALVPRQGMMEVNIALRPDPIRLGSVEASPSVPVPWGQGSPNARGRHRTVTAAAIRNHPLLAESDVFSALGGSDVFLQPETPNGVHVQGGAPDHTGYELDGIPILAPYHSAGLFSSWNVDALSEVGLRNDSRVSSTLSGVVTGTTKRPGSTLGGRAAISSTQARLTIDGPIGESRFGHVVSVRSGFPSNAIRKSDPVYLGSETGDLMAKVQGPLLGGQINALVYRSDNEVSALSTPIDEGTPANSFVRNRFEWTGGSYGVSWTRPLAASEFAVSAWRADSDVEGTWFGNSSLADVRSVRNDLGLMAEVQTRFAGGLTRLGLRGEDRSSRYSDGPETVSSTLTLVAHTKLITAFGKQRQEIVDGLFAEAEVNVTRALGSTYTSPRFGLEWAPSPRVVIEAEASRRHQFTQSLRNNESIVGNVLPADFAVGADGERVPVASSDQVQLTGTWTPAGGVSLRTIAYARSLKDVTQVAVSSGDPFATGSISSGQGSVLGLGVDGGVSGTRYGATASYGWQQVRYDAGAAHYIPQHGVAHRAQAGVTVYPTPTLSLRFGGYGQWGRRATGVSGLVEWEACNVLDLGCEFGGTPRTSTDRLGENRLPRYLRVDLGVRKHWHLEIGTVDGTLGIYGTVANLFGISNALNFGNTLDGEGLVPISTLPRTPLVIGLDWQF